MKNTPPLDVTAQLGALIALLPLLATAQEPQTAGDANLALMAR